MKCLVWRHSFHISETDPEKIKEIFDNFLLKAKFVVVGFTEYHLDSSYGCHAATWVLAESHFAFRIFPKEGITYCEISSCIRSKYVAFLGLVEPMSVSTTEVGFLQHQHTTVRTGQKDLKEIFGQLLPKATFRVVGFAEYIFPGDGCTLSWTGDDFHINIHTFPEDRKSVIEVTSFNRGRFFMLIRMLDEPSIKKMRTTPV
jgi:S-adenosylmethionine decarboxylase